MVSFSTVSLPLVLVSLIVGFCGRPTNGQVDVGVGILYKLEDAQDVFLEGDTNTMNSIDQLIVGNVPSFNKKRFLVQFENISPTCTTILWAKMYLHFFRGARASFQTPAVAPFIPRTLQVHQVKKAWNENQATRSLRLTSIPWSTQYLSLSAALNGDAADYTQDTYTVFPGLPQGYVEFDMTEAARNWKDGAVNNGLLVWATNENEAGTDLRFYSRRHIDATKRPFVNVLCAY